MDRTELDFSKNVSNDNHVMRRTTTITWISTLVWICCLLCVLHQISGPEIQQKELQTKHRPLHTKGEESAAAKRPSESFSQRNALFNKEALQVKHLWHANTRAYPTTFNKQTQAKIFRFYSSITGKASYFFGIAGFYSLLPLQLL